MNTLLKIAIPCVGCITAGGGLVGSNYVFKKQALISIKDNEDDKWTEKVSELLEKIKESPQLSAKIDKDHHDTNLRIVLNNNNREFGDKDKAKESLKAWCLSPNKEAELKKVEDELCNNKQEVGWLFGK